MPFELELDTPTRATRSSTLRSAASSSSLRKSLATRASGRADEDAVSHLETMAGSGMDGRMCQKDEPVSAVLHPPLYGRARSNVASPDILG